MLLGFVAGLVEQIVKQLLNLAWHLVVREVDDAETGGVQDG